MRSMTAFGRVSFGNFQIEIHSLNRKNLEISTMLPKEFGALDLFFRKAIQKSALRGTITVKLFKQGAASSSAYEPSSLMAIKKEADALASHCGVRSASTLAELLELAERLNLKGEDVDASQIESFFEKAVEEWTHMKEVEGAHLAKDLESRLLILSRRLQMIKEAQKNAPKAYAERLKKRLEELNSLDGFDDARVIKEVVIFSEKVDTTEEIVRLESHLEQFQNTLRSSEDSVGRKLDFLIQEMNREVNSLGVKCQDLEIVKETLEMKAEIEKIREQVQNIE